MSVHRCAAGAVGGVRWAAALAWAAALFACAPGADPEHRLEGRLGRVGFFRPSGPPSAFVILLSDADGWSPRWEGAGRELAERGAAVVGVDLREYLAGLRASDDGCHSLVAELEGLSKRLQRELGSERLDRKTLYRKLDRMAPRRA